ncbi:hypothetical protein ACFOND_15210 [Reinekea marina]|uniref:Uncharacterized protein n=1 Tax=Reinekea marina TaxID=1310421 RepID=A0ABV7WUX4_9GAMM
MEKYQRIFTQIALPDTFSEYLTMSLDDNNLVVYASGMMDEKKSYLITVEDVVAFQVLEEFCHPNMDRKRGDPVPPFSNEAKKIYYPMLRIENSIWIDSFSENRLRDHRRESAMHYKLLSYSNVIDFISNRLPEIKEIRYDEYIAIKELIGGNFT